MSLLIQQKGLDKADKIQLVISYTLQLIMFVALGFALVKQNWLSSFIIIGILFLTFLPKIIRLNYKVSIPVEFDLVAIIFIFTALFLGEVHAYYTIFWWWDVVLHTSSGFLLGILGFLLVFILNEEPKVHLRMKPGFVAIFAFAFAVALGCVWEIFEFGIDSFFGFNMQSSGLVDTMWDLIVDSLGAIVIAIFGYFYIRKGQSTLFDRMIHRFVDRNPRLFRRRRK